MRFVCILSFTSLRFPSLLETPIIRNADPIRGLMPRGSLFLILSRSQEKKGDGGEEVKSVLRDCSTRFKAVRSGMEVEAASGIRTLDPSFTKAVLYR